MWSQFSSLIYFKTLPSITLWEFEYLTASLETWRHWHASSLTLSLQLSSGFYQKNTRKSKRSHMLSLSGAYWSTFPPTSQPNSKYPTADQVHWDPFIPLLFSFLAGACRNPTLYPIFFLSNSWSEGDWANLSLFVCLLALKEQIKPTYIFHTVYFILQAPSVLR